MAEDFQSSNWWNTSKNCNDHSDNSNSQFSGFAYSASSSDWTRTPTAEPSFHAMLREDLNTGDFLRQEPKEINQPLFLASSSSSSSSSSSTSSSSSYGCSATMSMIQSLIEPDTRFRPFSFDNRSHMTTYGAGSNEIQQNPMLLNSLAQMQFSNSSSFWNASSVSPIGTLFYETKPCFTTVAAKSLGGQQEKNNSGESVMKKPRIETPAPFKVRKEKLGDKITALQQLVSPFGKTDTASVLHEAIEYIKLLQDQVSVLCTPYLMNTQPKQQQKNSGKSKKREESMQDLRSRGLCLVPIAITYPVASDATSDFWTPTFEGTYG